MSPFMPHCPSSIHFHLDEVEAQHLAEADLLLLDEGRRLREQTLSCAPCSSSSATAAIIAPPV